MTTTGIESKGGDGGGALLSRHRARAGWTVEQLATALKISPAKLRALEGDRYEELGEPVFYRGYAASACRILGVDPRSVLERLPAAKPGLPARLPTPATTTSTPRQSQEDPAGLAAASATAAPTVQTAPHTSPGAPTQHMVSVPTPVPTPAAPPAAPIATAPPSPAERSIVCQSPAAAPPAAAVGHPALSATGDRQSLFDEAPPVDAGFTARPTPPVLHVEPPILLDPPITLDPAPLPGLHPDPILDLPPSESRAAPWPETPGPGPWSTAYAPEPNPSPPSPPDEPRSPWSGRFASIRSRLGVSGARSGVESPHRHGGGTLRRRWITATVTVSLVAMAVVGIGRPMLDIDRPDKAAAAPADPPTMAADTPGLATTATAATAQTPAGTTRAAGEITEAPTTATSTVAAAPAPAPAPAPVRSPLETPAKRPAPRADSPTAGRTAELSRAAEAAKAQKPVQRYVVQLAAYRNLAQAREVRRKVESLGLRAYYQTLNTAEGRRFRVRVGPFATRTEAERAQKRVASLRFSGNVLLL